MDSISQLTGHSTIAEQILNEFNLGAKLINLRGQIGSGKSEISDLLKGHWETDKNKLCLKFKRRENGPSSAYTPFYVGLSQFYQEKTEIPHLLDPALNVGKSVPQYGKWADFLTKLLNFSNDVRKEKTQHLNQFEHEILYRFNRLFKKTKLLIIVPDILDWDDSSIQLLQLILSTELNDVYEFTKDIKVLIVTDNEDASYTSNLEPLILLVNKVISLKSINKDQLIAIFKFYDYPIEGISPSKIDDIYKLTGGNLYLITKLIEYLKNDNNSFEVSFLSVSGQSSFVNLLLKHRLEQSGIDREDITDILEYASVIGVNFDYKELECITKYSDSKLKQIIQKASEIYFVDISQSSPSFSNEIIRAFFLERVRKGKPNLYGSFSECIRLLRPSDYLSRANLFFESGNFHQAAILYIMTVLQVTREGFPSNSIVEQRASHIAKEYFLEDYLIKMKKAYAFFLLDQYEKVLETLKRIDFEIYPDVLKAELSYLQAICYTKSGITSDIELAKTILLQWSDLKVSEPEIWTRIMSSLTVVYIHLNEIEDARLIEKHIKGVLRNRIEYDKGTQYQYFVIQRKSAMLFETEIAIERTESCVKYFGSHNSPLGKGAIIQLYMALANHSGNNIALGNFNLAFDYAGQALSLIDEHSFTMFPRKSVPTNNLLISGVLSNKLEIDIAIKTLTRILDSGQDYADKYILKNNLACFYGLNGEIIKGKEVLESTISLMESLGVNDSYYWYYIQSNYLAFAHLSGERNVAEKILNKLKESKLDIVDSGFHRRRIELLSECLNNINPYEHLKWDSYLIKNYQDEIGLGWKFYAKGFLFSDLQFWTES